MPHQLQASTNSQKTTCRGRRREASLNSPHVWSETWFWSQGDSPPKTNLDTPKIAYVWKEIRFKKHIILGIYVRFRGEIYFLLKHHKNQWITMIYLPWRCLQHPPQRRTSSKPRVASEQLPFLGEMISETSWMCSFQVETRSTQYIL